MRKIIAALQTSLDSFIEGPNGELDWAMAEDQETWSRINDTLDTVDTIILGRKMYPEYEKYWLGLLANPTGTKNENAYAQRAEIDTTCRPFYDPRKCIVEYNTK